MESVKEVLESHNIEYKNSTKDYIILCLNPEHDDSKPSCNVDKLSGVFHCWSCGDAGNIYERFNLEIPSFIHQKADRLKQMITDLMWSKPLERPLDAADYTWDFRGISKETLAHFGAFTSDDKSLDMEGRIIFPLEDIDENITLFMGRMMHSDIDPRYKNYPPHVEVPLFPEVPEHSGSIVMVEGIFDMLNLYDKGIKNVVMCGGVHLGLVKKRAKQLRNIERLLPYKYQGINTLNLMFDGDKAGRDAAKGLEGYASETFNINIVELEDDQDPGCLTQEQVNKIKEKLK